MWHGSLSFETPMLFALAFLFLFTIGGFSGLMLGHRAGRLPVPRHLLRRRALPLRAGAGRRVRDHGRRLLLAAEVDRPHVRRRSSPSCTSGCRRSSSTCCSSRSTSSGSPACRGASPTTRRSSPTGTWCPRSARSASASRSCCSCWSIWKCARGGAKASAEVWEARGARPRVVGAVAGAVPHVRRGAGRQVSDRTRQCGRGRRAAAPGPAHRDPARARGARASTWRSSPPA